MMQQKPTHRFLRVVGVDLDAVEESLFFIVELLELPAPMSLVKGTLLGKPLYFIVQKKQIVFSYCDLFK